ncbi:MAG: ABC transporter ATP-binding protein/permease [Eubacteriales bacterium]|nr:ABC transporter ATP-binding protein/permease [Eubacteriales bacterium]
MLQLKDITKKYYTGDSVVDALCGVSVDFRESEFVSILGHSGCGKTTLLNIIGGLDRYTSGDLYIGGKSTKTFVDTDWDEYRNHSIGFVFQSYNLIMHQTVIENVELALTLSGVSKKERYERAKKALEDVGLGESLNKKPNQLSGGQMQRVAIARALVNDPEIILADEPTGALDTETSIQIMDILKSISANKLIIMVTHNPELAEQYSDRIIRLSDGKIVDDSNPYKVPEGEAPKLKSKGSGKTSMSFKTALSLSFRNLMTKKGRTFITAFAGSIGIIGIALILSLSTGINDYIDNVEAEALNSYPIEITEQTADFSSIMNSMVGISEEAMDTSNQKEGYIYSSGVLGKMINSFSSSMSENDLSGFKKYIDSHPEFQENCSNIKYSYSTKLNVYSGDTSKGIKQIQPSTVMSDVGMDTVMEQYTSMASPYMDTSSMNDTMEQMMGLDIWMQLSDDNSLIEKQYDVVEGRLPENYDEIVIMVDKDYRISDYALYSLGLKDSSELSSDMIQSFVSGEELKTEDVSYSYDELMNLNMKLVLNSDYYNYNKKTKLYDYMGNNGTYMKKLVDNGLQLKVVGIIKPADGTTVISTTGGIGYKKSLMDYAIKGVTNSKVVQEQLKNTKKDVTTGKQFVDMTVDDVDLDKIDWNKIDMNKLDLSAFSNIIEKMTGDMDIGELATMDINMGDMKTYAMFLNKDQKDAIKKAYIDSISSDNTQESALKKLGYSNVDDPSMISIYPINFDAKAKLTDMIKEYNDSVDEDKKIVYTDTVGILMTTVTRIIDIVTYVLICFVAISLVVSSIMIGVITYVSVLERTKEIGILRAIGASKKDIRRVFNAETFIIGLVAGALGIVLTLLLNIPINLILNALLSVKVASNLPLAGGIILVVISVGLTIISGLMPANKAAEKDPVEALRTE